jgi:hypothetical protein
VETDRPHSPADVRPPATGRTPIHWLLEGAFIVVSVVLGFTITEYGEYREERKMRRAAWDTALSTGSLRLIDYDLAAALSEIYGMQDYAAATFTKNFADPSFFDPFGPAAGRPARAGNDDGDDVGRGDVERAL